MRSIFGWSLPPGVRTLPGEEPTPPCECCGQDPEATDTSGCICPECPVCESFGDPTCYSNGHLSYSILQLARRDNQAELQRLEHAAEAAFWDSYAEKYGELDDDG